MVSCHHCLRYPHSMSLVPESPQELGHRAHWCLRTGHPPAAWCPSKDCRLQGVGHQGPQDQEPGWCSPRDIISGIPWVENTQSHKVVSFLQRHEATALSAYPVFSLSLGCIYIVAHCHSLSAYPFQSPHLRPLSQDFNVIKSCNWCFLKSKQQSSSNIQPLVTVPISFPTGRVLQKGVRYSQNYSTS